MGELRGGVARHRGAHIISMQPLMDGEIVISLEGSKFKQIAVVPPILEAVILCLVKFRIVCYSYSL